MIDLELFGGSRGYLSYLRSRTMRALGAYRGLTAIDWASVDRLVFVCKGNICRSPYASARAQSLGARAISCGLEAKDGAPADPAAARNALARGLDLSTHRSARLCELEIGDGDLIMAFEPAQLVAVRERIGSRRASTSLVGLWAKPGSAYIHDPYGSSDRYFQQCFAVIDAAVVESVRRMQQPNLAKPSQSTSGFVCR